MGVLKPAPSQTSPTRAQLRPAGLHHLRTAGYRVFARPRISGSDIDRDMLTHLARREDEGALDRVVVFSHDGRNFLEPLVKLATTGPGVEVTVVGFEEFAHSLASAPELEFVDIEDIAGAFARPLPRTRLADLPDAGGWLEPLALAS